MNILIIEDELTAAERLNRLTRAILDPEVPAIQMTSSISEGLKAMRSSSIELLMLDLNLHGNNGFQLLRQVLAEPFQTIIVSAYRDQAIVAFEYGVLDFVPKPVEKSRLKKAIDRFLGVEKKRPEKTFLEMKINGVTKYVSVDDIRYVRGANIYTEIVMNDGDTILYEKSLDKTLQFLGTNFIRIHKSYLARKNRIRKIVATEGSRYRAILETGEALPVGRTRLASIRSLLEKQSY